jgi:hypothetical protein
MMRVWKVSLRLMLVADEGTSEPWEHHTYGVAVGSADLMAFLVELRQQLFFGLHLEAFGVPGWCRVCGFLCKSAKDSLEVDAIVLAKEAK